ncbi:DMT family transporter [Halorarum halophilum]|uniref:DMT family transporter n=1 Tax=Halorarum halophilum TaxID=2743090 RepID=A0A7D5H2V5_9EURY|nr:DMT family transporter [Halobaculum halophilum]QLG29413.1 DMT family transporter [Halobaculum halophilum]
MAVAEERVPPLAALVVAVLAVSTSAILVEWSHAPSIVKALYRVVFTIALLLPIVLGRPDDRAAFRRLRPRDTLVAVAAGLALAVHFAAWFESLRWTSVAASVTLVQAQPLFVAAGAWALLDERVTRKTVLGIGVALAGMLVMSGADVVLGTAALAGERPLFGNALAVLGAVTAASYVLAGRSLRQRLPLLPYVLVVYASCALALLVATIAQGYPLVGYRTREWLLFLAMAVGPGVFGHTVINWALAHVESSVVSVSLLGEPVGSTLLAVFLLAEYPTPMTLVGGAVVLAGVYLTAAARRSGS